MRQHGVSRAGLCQGQNLDAMSFVLMMYVDTYIAVTLHLVLGIIEEMIYCNMGWWGAFILIPKGAADKVILDFVSMKLQQLTMFQGPGLTGLRHSLMVPKPSVNSDFFSVLSENGG